MDTIAVPVFNRISHDPIEHSTPAVRTRRLAADPVRAVQGSHGDHRVSCVHKRTTAADERHTACAECAESSEVSPTQIPPQQPQPPPPREARERDAANRGE
jgi:hypothetical protein